MPNPFFSGRIPNELNEKVNEYIQESGKTKTDILIEALAQYLNFPVEARKPVGDSEELWKAIKELQERVAQIELGVIKSLVINNDNYDNINGLVGDTTTDNSSDNKEGESGKGNVITSDNSSDNKEGIKPQPIEAKTELPEFKEIITAEVVKKTNLTRNQIKWLMDGAIEKVKQQEKIIEPGELLKEPIEVSHKSGIKINENPYKLFYAGENSKEKAVWNLIPDNTSYQPVIIETSCYTKLADNKGYHEDNKKNITEEAVDLNAQELVEKVADEQT